MLQFICPKTLEEKTRDGPEVQLKSQSAFHNDLWQLTAPRGHVFF